MTLKTGDKVIVLGVNGGTEDTWISLHPEHCFDVLEGTLEETIWPRYQCRIVSSPGEAGVSVCKDDCFPDTPENRVLLDTAITALKALKK